MAIKTESADYIDMFNSANPTIKRKKDRIDGLFKNFDKFEWVFLVALVGLVALVIYLSDNTAFFGSYGGCAFGSFCIFATYAVVILLKFIKNYIVPYKYSVQCSRWIVENRIDALRYIKDKYGHHVSNLEFKNITGDLFDFARGVLFARNPKSRSKTKTHIVISFAVIILLSSWLAFVVPFTFPIALRSIGSGDNLFVFITIIPVAALFVLRIVLFFAFTMPDTNRVTEQYFSK